MEHWCVFKAGVDNPVSLFLPPEHISLSWPLRNVYSMLKIQVFRPLDLRRKLAGRHTDHVSVCVCVCAIMSVCVCVCDRVCSLSLQRFTSPPPPKSCSLPGMSYDRIIESLFWPIMTAISLSLSPSSVRVMGLRGAKMCW